MDVDLRLSAAKDALQSQLRGGWSRGSKRVAGETKMTLGKNRKKAMEYVAAANLTNHVEG